MDLKRLLDRSRLITLSLIILLLGSITILPTLAITVDELIYDSYYEQWEVVNGVSKWVKKGSAYTTSTPPIEFRYGYYFNKYRSDGTTVLVQEFQVQNPYNLSGTFRPVSIGMVVGYSQYIDFTAQAGEVQTFNFGEGAGTLQGMWESVGEQTSTVGRFRLTLMFPNGFEFGSTVFMKPSLNWNDVTTTAVYSSDPVVLTVREATISDIKDAVDSAADKITASLDKNSKEIQEILKGEPVDTSAVSGMENDINDWQSKEDEVLNNAFNGSYIDPDSGEEIKIDMNGNIFDQITSFFGDMYQGFIGVVGYGTKIFRFVLQFFIDEIGIVLIFPLTLGVVGSILGRS